MVVAKAHAYLNIPWDFRSRVFKYVWHFVTTNHQSINGILKLCIACLIAPYLVDYYCFIYTFLLYFFRMLSNKNQYGWNRDEPKDGGVKWFRKSSRRWVENKFQNILGKPCITSRIDTTARAGAIIKNSKGFYSS